MVEPNYYSIKANPENIGKKDQKPKFEPKFEIGN